METVRQFLENNQTDKDIIVYEYKNPKEYLIQGANIYRLNDNAGTTKTDNEEEREKVLNAAILCDYNQGGLLFLQVDNLKGVRIRE